MKQKFSISLIVAIFAATISAQAWNGYGHSCAAYIAEQHLTPEAKAKCEHYLNHAFVFYASWMDQWRFIGPYQKTNGWHVIYVDDAWKLDTKDKRAQYHTERIWKEMKNYKNLPDSLVKQNLIYLIHMVPDYHCPVHTFFKKGTFQERNYSLRSKGKKLGLHTFWDRSASFKRNNWSMERYAKEVDIISPKVAKKYQKGDAVKWAIDAVKQSNRLYSITPADTDIAKMEAEQVKRTNKLTDEMLLKGAYRLAYIINDIFKE